MTSTRHPSRRTTRRALFLALALTGLVAGTTLAHAAAPPGFHGPTIRIEKDLTGAVLITYPHPSFGLACSYNTDPAPGVMHHVVTCDVPGAPGAAPCGGVDVEAGVEGVMNSAKGLALCGDWSNLVSTDCTASTPSGGPWWTVPFTSSYCRQTAWATSPSSSPFTCWIRVDVVATDWFVECHFA